MALAFFQKYGHAGNNADGRNRNSARTHGVTIIGCQYFQCFHHFERVVERLAHAHKNQVCQFVSFGNGLYLINDFVGSKISGEALFARHAKETIHFAANLGRYAKGSSVGIGNVDGFDM